MRWGSGDVYTGGGANSGLGSSWGRGLLTLSGSGRIGSGRGYNCMLYYQYTGGVISCSAAGLLGGVLLE